MRLRDICERTGISKRNVHFYIKEGLLEPRQDPENGYYAFSEEDCRRLGMVRLLRDAGFSIVQIRSMLQTPSTSVYYMNQRLKQLRKEIRHLSQLEESIAYMQQNLPLHPGFPELEALVRNAAIPTPAAAQADEPSAETDIGLVNRYLWESFLPDTPLTDYQEYLWTKINHMSVGDCESDYRRLSLTLHSFSDRQIRTCFSDNRRRHSRVICLREEDYTAYADQMVRDIRSFLERPGAVSQWRSQYLSFIAPSTRLYDSSMAEIMAELSPSFAAYRKNVHAVCDIVYDRIRSREEEDLRRAMETALGDLFDIDGWSHGQLQAMAASFN